MDVENHRDTSFDNGVAGEEATAPGKR